MGSSRHLSLLTVLPAGPVALVEGHYRKLSPETDLSGEGGGDAPLL